MHEMQTTVTDVHGVCLSCGSPRLHCAKMAEEIKMLFGVNNTSSPWNAVRHADPFTQREEDIILNFGTTLITWEWLKLLWCAYRATMKTMQQ